MRVIISIFLILTATLSYSQTRNIKVNTKHDISQEKIDIKLNSQVENLDHCSIQILDTAKKAVKTANFPKAIQKPGIKQWTEVTVPIIDLAPGNYTFVLYLGKEEMEKGKFSKSSQYSKFIHEYCDSLYHLGLFNGNILVADKGNIVHKESFGKANEKTGQSLDENTIFELASLSKQFTAMAVIILKEKNKLSLDDKLSKFIPELSAYSNVIVRNLLNHTSGLPDYISIMDSTFDKSKIATNADVISVLAKYNLKTSFPPNTKFEYSNTGYALLASIIERVSGQTYADFLRDKIFVPLDMKNSLVYCRRKSPKNLSNYAYGYIATSSKRKILPDSFPDTKIVIWLDGIVGDGCVNSTITDLLKWDRALYSDKLCSKESMKEIFSRTVLSDKTNSNYGFVWEIIADKR